MLWVASTGINCASTATRRAVHSHEIIVNTQAKTQRACVSDLRWQPQILTTKQSRLGWYDQMRSAAWRGVGAYQVLVSKA